MRKDLEHKLQETFSFMQRPEGLDGYHDWVKGLSIYENWGIEADSGWYDIIYQLCQDITDCYKRYDIKMNFYVLQIKEKFGTLRFYYAYEDSKCGISAIDFLGNGSGIRFTPGGDESDETKTKLRKEIADIVKAAEKKSATVCELCGDTHTAMLRTNLGGRISTLCDGCVEKRQKSMEERHQRLEEKLWEMKEQGVHTEME